MRMRLLYVSATRRVLPESTATLKTELANLNTIVTRFSDFSKMPAPQFVRVNVNEALRNVPAEQVRLHICWGNYQGPHVHDIALEKILPTVLRAKAGILSIEGANPRHGHEWEVFRRFKLPDDKVLMPGVIDSTTNFVEHPQLVAQRICRYADAVGRERVIAGVDCGFETFAGDPNVDERIVYHKFASLAEGARIATAQLWPRTERQAPGRQAGA